VLILKENFYLLINNFAVHLQQSLMLFALQRWGTTEWLGAYALGDKVIWSARLLLMSISNAVYPSSAKLFNNNQQLWIDFKNKVRLSVGFVFLAGSVFLFIFPQLIIHILVGESNQIAILFLQQMAFVPFIAALNLMNVLDRLLHNDHFTIFKIAMIILVLSTAMSYLLVRSGKFQIYGYYPLVIEACAFLLYEINIRRKLSKRNLAPETV
jgi:O-antigen/teichoic acid export membrane protein